MGKNCKIVLAANQLVCFLLGAAVTLASETALANAVVIGDELVSNGSFESGSTGWSFSYGSVKTYANQIICVSPDLVRVEGAGDRCALVEAKNASTSGYASQTVTVTTPGVYRLRVAYAARSVNGTSYAGATTKVTLGDLFVTSFTTTDRHVLTQEWHEDYVYVPAAGSYVLKFQSFNTKDSANIIDLVSLCQVQAGFFIAEGEPVAPAEGGLPRYGKWYPKAGDVLSAPESIDLSRTETADCLGYKLYTLGEEPPEFVKACSYTVTAEDVASMRRLVWQWRVRERKYKIDPEVFSRKCVISITGYSGESTLTNFPVLVKLRSDCPSGLSYGDMANDGCDLRFADENGDMAPYEIDTWNPDGETIVWVRVPELKKSGAVLTMYYGATDVSKLPPAVGSDVWGDYVGVWHMNVQSDWTVAESTVNAMHGAVQNTTASVPDFPGMIGGSFTNSNNAYVWVEASDARKAMKAPFTFSSWVYNQAGGSNASIWNDKNDGRSAGSEAGVEIGLEGNYQKFITRGKGSIVYSPVPTFYQTWRHLVVVYENDQSYVYMDGVCVTNGAVTLPYFSTEGKLALGQRVGTGVCAWKGVLDEMRIRDSVRLSDDWIAAEYANQKADADFVTFGEVQKTKVAVLAIGNAGLTVDGATATMLAQISLDESGETACAHVVYGDGETLSQATATQERDSAGALSATMTGLFWATRYAAQWEAWNKSTPEKKVTADVCRFTTDGTPQVEPELNCSVVGTGVQISAQVTELRGPEPVTVRLYRAAGADEETLVETKTVSSVGTVDFAVQQLAWGCDYTYRAEFEQVRDGVGAWTNNTEKLMVSVQDAPEKCKFSTFGHCSDIIISGYRGKEALRDFPVLVRLSAGHPEKFDYASCGMNGENIRFADANGGLIPHEVDTWNPNGESLVWVRVPVLMGKATRIRLYFDPQDPQAMPAVDSADVWKDFLAVWHMDVANDWSVKESGQHALNGTVKSGEPGSETPDDPSAYAKWGEPGILGGAFTNSNWAYVLVPADESFATLTSSLTFSAWVRGVGVKGTNAVIWNNAKGGTTSQADYGLEIGFNPNAFAPDMALDVRGSNSLATLPLERSVEGDWHLVTVVYRDKTVTVYEDDCEGVAPVAAEAISPVKFRSTDNLALGQRIGSNACKLRGNLDEMRISTKMESADWVKAEYDTVMNADFAVPQKAVFCRKGLVIFIQ